MKLFYTINKQQGYDDSHIFNCVLSYLHIVYHILCHILCYLRFSCHLLFTARDVHRFHITSQSRLTLPRLQQNYPARFRIKFYTALKKKERMDEKG